MPPFRPFPTPTHPHTHTPPHVPALILLVLAAPVRAQEGSLSRVFPNGAQRGQTVTLTFAGKDLPEPGTLLVDGPGIEPVGSFVKGVGQVRIAPDAAPGVRLLSLAGPKGATSPRPFAVGTLPELAEKEPNNTREEAQRVESLPVTLNGVLATRTEIDNFRVTLKKDQCLVVAGESRALGAPTNLLVRIRDTAGQELAVQMDYRTRDPLLPFVAPADGDYVVELQDVMNNYSNLTEDYVYRVTLTTGPWLDYALPLGARRGATNRLTVHGWNLGGKSGPSELPADVTVPADAPTRYEVTAGEAPNRVPVLTSDLAEVMEEEPNGLLKPQPLAVPGAVTGTLDRDDRDAFVFAARKGDRLLLEVAARSLGSFADARLLLYDSAGKLLQLADDVERQRDPRLLWTAPADGEYRAVVRDLAGGSRGGPGFYYRLQVAPPAPSLRLTAPSPVLLLKPGGKAELSMTLTAGYLPGPVTVSVEGLPQGLTAEPVTVTPAPDRESTTTVKLAFQAAADAPVAQVLVRITARSGDLSAPMTASWVLATDRSGTLATGTTDRLLLALTAN